MTMLDSDRRIAPLDDRLAGVVVRPGDAGWDDARRAYNLTLDQRPDAIALPADAGDVQAIVAWAREAGLRIAPQRTGHNAAPLDSLDGVLLLKTDRLDEVEIDPERLRARVGAGVKWESVVPQASDLGLAALHGSTPDVSIAGYGLGGGLGWYARKHGLFTNSITAIELVTADGHLRRVDAEHEPGLFWALRGGGGNFGVVTALEFRLLPIAEVYAGILFFPVERSAEVLHAWRDWTETVPDEMTSVGRILRFPPLEEIPEPMRGKDFVLVEAFFLGSEEEGAGVLAPLRALGPAIDTVATVPPAGLAEMHMDPPDPLPYLGESAVLGELPREAIDAFVAAVGPDSGSVVDSAEIRHTGGALARSGEGHGALDTFPGSYITYSVGLILDEAGGEALERDLARVREVLEPHRAGAYFNFEERPTDPARFYGEETYRRLREVKAAYDPDELFRANHPIPPAR